MIYQWKKTLEAVQLPGDLVLSAATESDPKKGDWLVFQEGKYIGFFTDKQWREQAEVVAAPRKKAKPQAAANGGLPRRRGPGRKALGRRPLQDGEPTEGLAL